MGRCVFLGTRRGNGESQGEAERPPCWLPAPAWPCDVDLGQAWLVKRVPSCSGLCAGKGQTQVPPQSCPRPGRMRRDPGSHHSGVHAPPLWPALAGPGRVGLGLSVAGQPGVFSAFSWTQPTPPPGTRPAIRGPPSRPAAAPPARVGHYIFSVGQTLPALQWCKRQARCPHRSRVPPAHPAPTLPRGGAPLQRSDGARGCRWPGNPLLGYFWPLCWPRGSLPKAVTEFASCFADGLECASNIPPGRPEGTLRWGCGGGLGAPRGSPGLDRWHPWRGRGGGGAGEGRPSQLLSVGAR